MPYRNIDDSLKLRRLLDAILMIEADVDLAVLLRHFVEEACDLVGARYGALGVLNESRTGLEKFLTVGLSDEEEEKIGPRPTGRGVLGLLITEPSPLRLNDLSAHEESYGFPLHHPPMKTFLGVPVRAPGAVYGNLYLTGKIGAPSFSKEDESLAEALALAAGIAIENTRLHNRVRLLSVSDDRDRIANDLHDRVIQRVFAVGLSLQRATRLTEVDEMVATVNEAVDYLDATITEIRTAIYELGSNAVHGGLRQGVLELVAELSSMLGARPEVNFVGPVDNAISQPIADNLLAVLREVLTNAGKHAGASNYRVTLKTSDVVSLEVVDNGVGIDLSLVGAEGLGLNNLRHRAEKLNGTFEIAPIDGGGTRVLWCVPILIALG